MPRDASATRARILRAAIEEFAAHGLAGGRVERITHEAEANPRSLYVYFGSKEGLFHASVDAALGALGEEVPVTLDDLPGYAAQTFDWIRAHPEAVRLNRWRQLEAPDAGPDDRQRYADMVRGMAADPQRPVDALPPADLLILIFAMAAAWVDTSSDVRAADGRSPDHPARIADHRRALVEAVSRLCGTNGRAGRSS